MAAELRRKFSNCYEVYEFTKERLQSEGAGDSVVPMKVREMAQKEVPLTADELRIYKMHVALQSVNGGELFAIDSGE